MNPERITRLGMLVPSSNTVVEPTVNEMAVGFSGLSIHYSRFAVVRIGLSNLDNDQFGQQEMVRSAALLADAEVDVIAWNGTSGSWLGFDNDESLCAAIRSACGIPACTSALALREILATTGARSIGLVTPYTSDVQQRIIVNFEKAGLTCPAERHLGLTENYSFARTRPEDIAAMVEDVAGSGCDAVAIVCTNLAGAGIVAELESKTGLPIYDSVAVTLWKSLRMAGFDTRRLARWGRLFANPSLNPDMPALPPKP